MTLRDRHVVRQEPEGVAGRRVALVVAIAVSVATGAVGVAWWVLPDAPVDRHPAEIGPAGEEVGEVYVTPIRRSAAGLRRRDEARERLREWGWIDRDEGIVRIPIERAMDIVAGAAAREPEVQP